MIEHHLSPEERICLQCGKVMEEIGKEIVETVKIISAQYILQRDIYYTYACRVPCSCKQNMIPDCSTPRLAMSRGVIYWRRKGIITPPVELGIKKETLVNEENLLC